MCTVGSFHHISGRALVSLTSVMLTVWMQRWSVSACIQSTMLSTGVNALLARV